MDYDIVSVGEEDDDMADFYENENNRNDDRRNTNKAGGSQYGNRQSVNRPY